MSNLEPTETASDHCVSASAHVVGVLAEALAQHEFAPQKGADHVGCFGCDWVSYGIFPRSEHAAHVASVVAALPNIAIVSLPEPTDTKNYAHSDEGEDYLGWEVQDGPYFISVYDQGEVQVSYDGNVEEPISVDYATDLGTALLAAAVRAAGGQA